MRSRARSPFGEDYLNQLPVDHSPDKSWLVAVLSLVIAATSLVLSAFQQETKRFWGMLGVCALMILVGFYRLLISGVRALFRRAHNAGVLRKNMQELRRFSGEAGVFLNGALRNDTLQAILLELGQRQPAFVISTKVPAVAIFHGHWYYLDARLHGDDFTPVTFHDAADELLSIVRSYTTFCVLPVFHMFASEFREVLTANEKSKLNAFQQQFVNFVNSYVKFLTRLNDEFLELPEFQTGIAYPPPL